MLITETARDVLARVAAVKRRMCEEPGLDAYDLAPMLEVHWPGGGIDIALLSDRDGIPVAVDGLRAERETEEYPTRLVFIADQLLRIFEAGAVVHPTALRPGGVLAARQAGDPSVRDVLIVTILDADGTISGALQPYTYDETGLPVFGDVEMEDQKLEGATPGRLREAMGLLS